MSLANLPSWAPSSIDPSKLQAIPGDGDLGLLGAAVGPSLTEGGLNFTPGGNTASGFFTTRAMPGGSTQSVYYNPQGQAVDVAGKNPDPTSWLDNLIKYGAMAASAYATGGGLMGLGTPGPGAEALGGSGFGDLGAASASVAPGAAASPGLASTFSNGNYVDPLFGAPEAGVPGATGTLDAAAPITGGGLGNGISMGGSGLSSILNKDLANALVKAGGKIFGGAPSAGGGTGGATGAGYGGGASGGRSFATFDQGESGMPQLPTRQPVPVAPISYNGGSSPEMLAMALRRMTGGGGNSFGGIV